MTRCACLRFASCLVTALLVTTHAAIATPLQAAVDPAPVPASVPAPAAKRPAVLTLESRTKTLAQAKLRQQLAPTLENERALAEEYIKAGVLDAAFDHFQAALSLDPHDVGSFDGLARIWRDWGFANLALPHAYRAAYWAPESAAAQNTLGTVLLRLGLFDAAREHFEQARALDPEAAYSANNLCYLELQRANAEAAIPLCREAAALDPASRTVRNNFAVALATAGDLDGAFAAFESDSSPAIAAYNQGIVLLATRQFDRARDAFARARTADPAFLPALVRLKDLSIPRTER